MFGKRMGVGAVIVGAMIFGGLNAHFAKADQPADPQPAAAATDPEEAGSLDSPAWRETLRAWNEWLQAEPSYSPAEAQRLGQELDAKLGRMSSSERVDFKSDLDAKLALLTGQAGRDYRLWVHETLAVASDAYARKLRAGLPDFAHMSASEVQLVFDRFEYERYLVQQHQEAHRRLQQQRIAAVRQDLRYQREAADQALARAGSRGNLDGHFAVPPQHHPQVKQFHSYNNYGYGWGFGFGAGGGLGFPIFFW